VLAYGLERSLALLADAASWAGRHGPALRAIRASTLPYHMAGATAVQELACAIATGVEYLRRMTAAGSSSSGLPPARLPRPNRARPPIEIAKLRALRRMWSRVVAASGGGERRRRPRSTP